MFEDLFYDRLIKLRAQKGVSAREMSLAIGQSPGYINGLENRNGFPSMQVFFYICEYLNVTPSEFFDDGNSYPSEYREMQKDMEALDEKKPPECSGDYQRTEALKNSRQRKKTRVYLFPCPFHYLSHISSRSAISQSK